MKIIIFCQGEGRGHLSQAITLTNILKRDKHKIEHCFIGRKDIPNYFNVSETTTINSPGFVQKNNKVNLFKTIVKGIISLPKVRKSLKEINNIIEEKKPDLILNFYEPLCGLWKKKYKSNILKKFFK